MFSTLAVSTLLATLASLSFAAEAERPSRLDATVVMLEATVTAVDHETREVTLEGPNGKTVTITAGEEVRNLAQVEVSDKVAVEYIEVVAMEVMPPNEMGMAAMTTAAEKTAPLGEKPAATAVQETKFITVVEAIDKETQMVTLKGPDGNSTTVKARNPANLEKIVIGDKVLVTHTIAAAISVTAK
jgi:Cu/Ag efflux protein CusF